MAFGRLGEALVLHGSPAAGLFRDAAAGSPVCVTATLLDGLVLARSARNHSMNYRSVTVHGDAVLVTDPEQIMAGLRAVVEHVTPDGGRRSASLPPPKSVRPPCGRSPSPLRRSRSAAEQRLTRRPTAPCRCGPATYRRG